MDRGSSIAKRVSTAKAPAKLKRVIKRTGNGNGANGSAVGGTDTQLDQHELLNALHAMQAGDFSVRLRSHQTGVAGKICDAFNTIVAANERIAQQLELRIEERTRERELALAQLFEAQKMDTIGRLTGGIAHDFNNLLMAVLGSLTLLEKRLPEDPQCRKLLKNALQGADRGKALTQRLLAFSRRQELKPEAVDVARLMSGMEELLKRAVGHGIACHVQLPTDLPPILADANQLELALLNVALNARDAMPAGGTIQISAVAQTVGGRGAAMAWGGAPNLPPGEYVRISIADNGEGMDEATLAKATEPFFTTKGPGKGTGLGLSMVQGLAGQSGGLLRIQSSPGAGTVVELWLPEAKTAPAPAVRTTEGAGVNAALTPCRVLVVDDDVLVMTGTSAMVQDLGHTPIEAQSAVEALRLLRSGVQVDVVLTDHAMPVMTGLQLAKSIQAQFPGLPIILATGYAELPVDPITLGIPRLAKPCTQEEIAAAIQAVVAAAQPGPHHPPEAVSVELGGSGNLRSVC